jgi:predicted amidophosphoribosyltransferase
MAICPNCGSEIDPDADFCEVCHHYIRQDVCSFCGAQIDPREGYCPGCGMPRGGIVCPTCHTLNDFSFCKQCGQPLTNEAKAIMEEMRQIPEYKELVALSREYNELQMQLPYETEADKKRGEALQELRERVLKLLAEDEGVDAPVIPAPHYKRVTKEELNESKQRKLDQLAELLSRMSIPPSPSPAKVRNYAMAQKPAGVRLAWKCNYKNALHSSPCGCAKPQMGGTWVILGHNSKQEIKDDK